MSKKTLLTIAAGLVALLSSFSLAAPAAAQPNFNGVPTTHERWVAEELNQRGGSPIFTRPLGTQHERPTLWSANSDSPSSRTFNDFWRQNGRLNSGFQPGWRDLNRAARERAARTAFNADLAQRGTFREPMRAGVELANFGDHGAASFLPNGGQYDLYRGTLGTLQLEALRAEGAYTGNLNVGREGVTARIGASGELILVGVRAETGRAQLGGDSLNVGAQARGRAYVGADGRANANLGINRQRAQLNGDIGAFAGGKATGDVTGTARFLGIDVRVKGTGEASYGIGAEARGYMTVDWSNMSVRTGGRAAATLGGGLGAGAEVEISAADAVKAVGGALRSGWNNVSNFFSRRSATRVVQGVSGGRGGGGWSSGSGYPYVPPMVIDPTRQVVGYSNCVATDCRTGRTTTYQRPIYAGDAGSNVGRNARTTPTGTDYDALRTFFQNGAPSGRGGTSTGVGTSR